MKQTIDNTSKAQAVNRAIIITDSQALDLVHFAETVAKCQAVNGDDDAIIAMYSCHDKLVPFEMR